MSARKHAARRSTLTYGDDQLQTLQRSTFRYFWQETNPENGLIPDNTAADDTPASIDGPDEGTLAPWAVVASLPFAPEIVRPTLQHCSVTYPKIKSDYGLVCSFNPTFPSRGSGSSRWISQGHFALDQGPVILTIENYASGLTWRLMRRCPYVVVGLRRAGFRGSWLTERPPNHS